MLWAILTAAFPVIYLCTRSVICLYYNKRVTFVKRYFLSLPTRLPPWIQPGGEKAGGPWIGSETRIHSRRMSGR